MVKNPTFSVRDAGSIPGQGTKIPHTMEQLSLQGQKKKKVSVGLVDLLWGSGIGWGQLSSGWRTLYLPPPPTWL